MSVAAVAGAATLVTWAWFIHFWKKPRGFGTFVEERWWSTAMAVAEFTIAACMVIEPTVNEWPVLAHGVLAGAVGMAAIAGWEQHRWKALRSPACICHPYQRASGLHDDDCPINESRTP